MTRVRNWASAAAIVLLCAPAVRGASTAAWEMNTYQDFVRGRFQGVALSRDGRLTLAPRLETVFSSDQPVVWSAVRTADGSIYVATGHRGRVFRIDASGKSTLLWTAPQPEVFALALDAKGVLYAASSPDGRVWRIAGGAATEYFNPGSRYIWSLAAASDGSLYVGTGDEGKVFRVTGPGQGELWYETGQSHVTSMALDREGRLLAGTEPNGILYRVSAKDKAFALYDASLPEIRAIAPAPDGSIYAAALGGSVAKRVQGAAQAVQAGSGAGAVPTTSMSITVEADAAQAGPEIKPPQPDAAKQQQAAVATQVTTQFTPTMDLTGVEKSAIYRINPDNTVETVWSSKEENAYDLLHTPERLLISTDGSGRVYALTPDRKLTLLVQTNEGEATRLLSAAGAVLTATGNMGRVYRLADAASATGNYESPVYDTGSTARWGSLSWRGQMSGGASVTFQTRSGNSARPDRSWSDWSQAIVQPGGARVTSPNARYIQWRAGFTAGSGAGAGPSVNNVSIAYLPQNTPPVIKSINVVTHASTGASGAKAPAPQAVSSPYSITVTDTGDASVSTASGTPTTVLTRAVTPQINVTWVAEDTDGDRLTYALHFRGEEEQEWKLLKGNLHENTLSFDGDALADGKYFFRVIASDHEANPPASARTGELVTAPVLIDNTPPVVSIAPARRTPLGVSIEFEVADGASPLRRCEYSLNAGGWVPVEAADGVVDSQREKFVLDLRNVPAGEHLIVIRAVDSAGNAGLSKVILR